MKKLILVVEDNEPDVVLLEDSLERVGVECEVRSVADGVSAREWILAARDAPDLILLDLNVPRINGLMLLRDIRASEALKSAPVIVWSSTRASADERALEDLAVIDFKVKPHNVDGWRNLASSLRDWLEKEARGYSA